MITNTNPDYSNGVPSLVARKAKSKPSFVQDLTDTVVSSREYDDTSDMSQPDDTEHESSVTSNDFDQWDGVF